MKDSIKDHVVKADAQHTFQGFPLISDQVTKEGVGLVWRELERVLQAETPGHVVEFGCYAGTTSLFIRRLLNAYDQSAQREFHVYDSFEGLPEKSTHDTNAAGIDFEAGKLYVSKADFTKAFRAAHLELPAIHKGWFNQLSDDAIPDHIAFAFLDGDFYQSIIDSLRLVWPRMTPGGTILIDDYKRETLPGVERAIADFFQGKQVRSIRGEHTIAVIHLNN